MISVKIDEDDNCALNLTHFQDQKRTVFNYPCHDVTTCKPYTVILRPGIYKFETWGAQGGDSRYHNIKNIHKDSGGKGAYASGSIKLSVVTKLFIYVGGKGEDQSVHARPGHQPGRDL